MNIHSRRTLVSAISGLTLAVGSASATLINFDDLGTGVLVTNQYPEVTFSSEAGEAMYTEGSVPVSYPNFICTEAIPGPNIDCVHDIYMDFTNPVSNITLWIVQPNEYGTVGTFYVYNGATLLGTQNLIGLALVPNTFDYGNQFVDLTSFTNVTRLELRGPGGTGPIDNSYGGVGIGLDDLSFKVAPAPNALSLVGLVGLGAFRRRRA